MIGKLQTLVVLIAAMMLVHPALALDLDQGRASGAVGERADGLIGAVAPTASGEVTALTQSVNTARLDTYRALAAREGTPVDAVQKLAGEKQIAKARQNGWYWMDAGGKWHKG